MQSFPLDPINLPPPRRRSIPIVDAATLFRFDATVDARPPAAAKLDALPRRRPSSGDDALCAVAPF